MSLFDVAVNLVVLCGVLLIVSMAVLLIVDIIRGGWPGSKKWDEQYVEKWFKNHSFCELCGSRLVWLTKERIYYEQSDGRPYVSEVWGCHNDHTHWDLVEWCQRKTYLDATAS